MRRTLVSAVVVAVVAVGAGSAGYALFLSGPSTPTSAAAPPRFVDDTSSAGLDTVYDGGVAYSVGGGVAAFDCNDDGKPDLFVPGGETGPSTIYVNRSAIGGTLRFEKRSGTGAELAQALGAYPLDIDGDGVIDLAVLRAGGTSLLRGRGGCGFGDLGSSLGFSEKGYDTAFSAKWEGSATLPTIAIGRYRKVDVNGNPTVACGDDALYRPSAGGTTYGPAVELSPGYCTLSILFSDWDRSGRRDLRVTNDRNYYVEGSDQLWRVAAGVDPTLYAAESGWISLQVAGSGIATYDVTGDGLPDYYISGQGGDELETLASGATQPMFRDIAGKRGIAAGQPFTGGDIHPSTAWHADFQDVNDDGFVDLFVAKGNVSAQPDFAVKDPSNLLLGLPDGTFQEAADVAGILSFARGRGAALTDFNLDGMVDLVELNYGAAIQVWRNVGSGDAANAAPQGHWLELRLVNVGSNRNAIGAWIEVQVGDITLRREIDVGGGHAGGQLGWVHFGLGPASSARVRVIWPDGTQGPWAGVNGNAFYEIRPGVAEPMLWQPES